MRFTVSNVSQQGFSQQVLRVCSRRIELGDEPCNQRRLFGSPPLNICLTGVDSVGRHCGRNGRICGPEGLEGRSRAQFIPRDRTTHPFAIPYARSHNYKDYCSSLEDALHTVPARGLELPRLDCPFHNLLRCPGRVMRFTAKLSNPAYSTGRRRKIEANK